MSPFFEKLINYNLKIGKGKPQREGRGLNARVKRKIRLAPMFSMEIGGFTQIPPPLFWPKNDCCVQIDNT